MTRRLRSIAVLLILGAGALALIASTQTWLDVRLVDSAAAILPVTGADAAPLVAPLGLAALALGLALSIVGRVLRVVFGVIAVAIGVSLVVSGGGVATGRPLDAVAGVVTETTGLAGSSAVRALVADITATPWPALTAVAGVVVAAGGVLTLTTSHRWTTSGRRFRTSSTAEGPASTGPAGAASTAIRAAAGGSRPHDAIDSWDDLSRGEDPTEDDATGDDATGHGATGDDAGAPGHAR